MEGLEQYFLHFPRELWAGFRNDTPLTLSAEEVERLQGHNQSVSIAEVEAIYLPLCRLLSLYVAASQGLNTATTRFLGRPAPKVPYIIGVAGSVAVGKSTTSRVLQALLSRWPHHPHVELITTDGYLFPNHVLEERGLMARKGFPESYNLPALLAFLTDLKAGKPALRVPLYSHRHYDIVPGDVQVVDQPDIVIVEGVNVLQVRAANDRKQPKIFVSDFFDFSIYVDAPTATIAEWYLQRFMLFRALAQHDSAAYFHRFTDLADADADAFARSVWAQTNEVNLRKNILPFRERARLILTKAADHRVESVWLKRT